MTIESNEKPLLLKLDLQHFGGEFDQPEQHYILDPGTPEPQNFGAPIQEPIVESPSSYKIKHNGQEHEMNIDQLIENAQKGFDYTQKSQQVKQWLDFEDRLKADPDFANYLADSIDRYGQPINPQAPQNPYNQNQPPQFNPQEEQVRLLQQQLQQMQGYLFNQETERQFNEFAKSNPDAVEQRPQLEQFLNNNPNLSYEDAYRLMNFDKLLQSQAQQFTDNQMAKQKVRVQTQNTGGAGQSSAPSGKMTPEDALKSAIFNNSTNIFGN